jgi:hypothetical protein
MKYFAIAITYVTFFTLIGFNCYFSGSLVHLWALLIGPTIINSISNFNDKI